MSWSDFERRVEIEAENKKGKTYADLPREGVTEDGYRWQISRYFPYEKYSTELVERALSAALAVVQGAPAGSHVQSKDRRPAWGFWDGRIDFRTLYPTVCGVEVQIETSGLKVCALIRHDSTGSCPSGPCGSRQEVITYTRPLEW